MIPEKRTKIVCTLGPASNTVEVISKLIDKGMNVARINFSHGKDIEHIEQIEKVREAEIKTNSFVSVIADLKGPKIRVGEILNHRVLLKEGSTVDIYLKEIIGNEKEFSILQKELFLDVKVGNTLLIDDGKVILEVLEVSPEHMKAKVLNDGYVSNNKGINAPGVILTMPFVSEKDKNDLMIAIKSKVNYIASSFVRRASDVLEIRKILDDNGGTDIGIIAKIENQEGIDNLEDIIKVSDGIMVARGDMGVEVPFELVPVYQKRIISLANHYGKPVITATHMLESMIHCPRPTRAEAGDVANAVLDGTDAVMLSGESAIGDYPVEAVDSMSKIIIQAEKLLNYKSRLNSLSQYQDRDINDAIGISVASCALNIKGAKAIFAFTDTGGTARRICHYRPSLPIVACTTSKRTCEKMSLYWGVNSMLSREALNFKDFDDIAINHAKELNLNKGDCIIMTSGFGAEHGKTNTIRLITL